MFLVLLLLVWSSICRWPAWWRTGAPKETGSSWTLGTMETLIVTRPTDKRGTGQLAFMKARRSCLYSPNRFAPARCIGSGIRPAHARLRKAQQRRGACARAAFWRADNAHPSGPVGCLGVRSRVVGRVAAGRPPPRACSDQRLARERPRQKIQGVCEPFAARCHCSRCPQNPQRCARRWAFSLNLNLII